MTKQGTWNVGQRERRKKEIGNVRVGEEAPPVELQGKMGERIAYGQYLGDRIYITYPGNKNELFE